MGKKCLVWTCSSNSDTKDVTLHSLGKARYESWLKAIGRSFGENISISNVICSKHFEKADFIVSKKRVYLNENAIPKLLLPPNAAFLSNETPETSRHEENQTLLIENNSCFPEELCIEINDEQSQTSDAEENSPTQNVSAESGSDCYTVSRPRKYFQPRYIGDCDPSDITNPETAKSSWEVAHATIYKQRKKIKTLQQSARRYKMKANSLKLLFKYLRENGLVTETGESVMKAFLKQ